MKTASVTDTVTMYAVREVGKNVPLLCWDDYHLCFKVRLTYFIDEAEKWKEEKDNLELVVVTINPYY